MKAAPPDTVPDAASANRRGWMASRRGQFVLITAVAVAIYIALRLLPTGTNLNHMDFRAEGGKTVEFCDPVNPQFIRVTEARSPVLLAVTTSAPPRAGQVVGGVVSMRTASGKPVGPADLLVVHTRPLHLMAVDPSLSDYQHLHPEPGMEPGTWTFSFTPRFGGAYRLFADFTPVATGRGLYASTDLAVEGTPAGADAEGAAAPSGYRFELVPSPHPIAAGKSTDFAFRILREDGKPVPLAPVMGAYAHLVAFDLARSGFAHLHPMQADPLAVPNATNPELKFNLTIPTAGKYIIWTQVNLAGAETYVPFAIEVVR